MDGELRVIWGAAAGCFLCVVVAELCLHLELFSNPV